MSAVEELRQESETICHLQNVSRLLNWDQQIVLTPTIEASRVRGRQQATLSRLAHERLVADSFGELLLRASDSLNKDVTSDDALVIESWQRQRKRALSLTPELVEKLAVARAEGFDVWRKARAENNFKAFQPYLEHIFKLKKEEAEQIGYEESPYDALLDEYEPGMRTSTVSRLFSELRPFLVDGVAKILASPKIAATASGPLDQDYDIEGQKKLSRLFAARIGFPSENRIDVAPHPFCSANSSFDVRLTTRYKVDEVAMALFSTMHEAGHGLYELHSPQNLEYTPLRGGCSLGVHESQSRLWENLVGRSQSFWNWAFPELRSVFPQQAGGYEASDFYAAVNRVRPSLIRVEADEVTYSLHVILRFELEQALLSGQVAVRDLPAIWNEKIKEFFGIEVPSDALGCLQDVHWADCLVGYFPTYALGNLIASDLWTLIERDLPDLQGSIARGDFSSLRLWLIDNIYSQASRYQPEVLLNKVLGHGIRVQPFIKYLQAKYSKLYQIEWG